MNLYFVTADGMKGTFQPERDTYLVLASDKEKAIEYVKIRVAGKGGKVVKAEKVRHGHYVVAHTFLDSEYDS